MNATQKMKAPAIWKQVNVFEYGPFILYGENTEPLTFRIEIQKRATRPPRFRARLYQSNTYELKPVFCPPNEDGSSFLAHAATWVLDDFIDEGQHFPTAQKCLAYAFNKINRQLGVQPPPRRRR
jgi:hypothetical protein